MNRIKLFHMQRKKEHTTSKREVGIDELNKKKSLCNFTIFNIYYKIKINLNSFDTKINIKNC